VGAGWDGSPIYDRRIDDTTFFLYIDSLPDKIHYYPSMEGYRFCTDIDTLIQSLLCQLPSRSGIIEKEGNRILINIRYDHDPVNVKPDKKLLYIVNTSINEALQDTELLYLINKTKYLYQSGFDPFSNGLSYEDLPDIENHIDIDQEEDSDNNSDSDHDPDNSDQDNEDDLDEDNNIEYLSD
jgi:hypothetical protein